MRSSRRETEQLTAEAVCCRDRVAPLRTHVTPMGPWSVGTDIEHQVRRDL